MFANATKKSLMGLIVVGVVLAGISVYIQLSSMDLAVYKLSDYIPADARIPAWWNIIGIPFLMGVLFVLLGTFSVWRNVSPAGGLRILLGSLVLSTLCTIYSPLAWFGVFGTIIWSIEQWVEVRKHNKSFKRDVPNRHAP